jgi:hypothetical protein
MDLVWVLASWVADRVADPTALLLLCAGTAALGWFSVERRIDAIRSREANRRATERGAAS